MGLLLIAYCAAFLAAALSVAALSLAVAGLFARNERRWNAIRRGSPSKLAAYRAFANEMLVASGLRVTSIKRMYQNLQRDVVRANYDVSARELLGQILLEGLGIFLVLLVACLFMFGGMALIIPFFAAYAWVISVRPSLTQADGEKRSRAIYRRLPYALDLGVLVLESGGTLRDAMEIIARNDDPLAEEFRTAIKEMDSGASQAGALNNMSGRVGVSALETIVMAINRGAETGAPMAQTLSTQAELLRERRLQEIEKMAVEAPTKMAFPNMLVMVSVLVLVLGPVLVKIGSSGFI